MFKNLFSLGFSPLQKMPKTKQKNPQKPSHKRSLHLFWPTVSLEVNEMVSSLGLAATDTCRYLWMLGLPFLGNAVNAYCHRFDCKDWILPCCWVFILCISSCLFWLLLLGLGLHACKLYFCSPPGELEFHCPVYFFLCPSHSHSHIRPDHPVTDSLQFPCLHPRWQPSSLRTWGWHCSKCWVYRVHRGLKQVTL